MQALQTRQPHFATAGNLLMRIHQLSLHHGVVTRSHVLEVGGEKKTVFG